MFIKSHSMGKRHVNLGHSRVFPVWGRFRHGTNG